METSAGWGGWRKYVQAKMEKEGDESLALPVQHDQNDPPPPSVSTVPRFADDLSALSSMFDSDVPPLVNVRVRRSLTVVYGFSDACGASIDFNPDLSHRIGVWSASEAEESSNWKELASAVRALEEEEEAGRLEDTMVFFLKDNSTMEAAIYNGTSSSEKLLDLVIRLKTLEMKASIKIWVIHCAGTRMIAQGTDGLSRGRLNEGVMAGSSMLSFVPTHLGAHEQSPILLVWL